MKKLIIASAIFLVLGSACLWMSYKGDKGFHQRQEELKQEGRDAKKKGVPANANPNKPGKDAHTWLEGWME